MSRILVLTLVSCLSFASSATTARYFRFTPTSYPGDDAYNLAMSEFVLLDGAGSVVAWPQGTTVTSDSTALGSYLPLSALVDGLRDQKCIVATPSQLRYPYIQIDAGQSVEFAAYGWWSSTYSGGDTMRISTGWTVETSADGQSWVLFDRRTGYPSFELKVNNESEYRGPFAPSVDKTIGKGEVYRVEDGDPILTGGGGEFAIFGTLDLNGHSVTIAHVSNQPTEPSAYLSDDLICDLSSAKIVNSSPTPATLSVDSMNFAGAITETVGKINLTLRKGTSYLVGYPKSMAPSKIRLEGTAELLPYSIFDIFCFRFKRNRAGNAAPIAVAEIQMTYGGAAIPETLRGYIGASPSTSVDADHSYGQLTDGSVYTEWISLADDQDVRVRIVTSDMKAPVDGYRIAAPSNADLAPTDWEVYVYRRFGWFKVDERHGEELGVRGGSYVQGKLSRDYRFDYEYRPSSQFGDQTEIEHEGRLIRIFGDVLSFGRLSGTQNVSLEAGTLLRSSDYSGWTGAFLQDGANNRDMMGRFLIDATRGGAAAQNARLKNPGYANISIENATATPAALLIDAAWPNDEDQPQYGRVADGNGPMGIVKRGAVKRVIETQDAAYTGDTRIEEGTLEVRGPRTIDFARTERKARYFRMTPLSYPAKDAYDYNFGISEIELLDAGGNKIDWPAGTTVTTDSPAVIGNAKGIAGVIDGVKGEKLILRTPWADNPYPHVKIDAGRIVTYGGWRWWTTEHDNNAAPRIPTGWKLETSFDGVNWTLVDSRPDQGGWENPTVSQQPWPAAESRTAMIGERVSETVTPLAGGVAPSPLKPFFADTNERTSHATALRSRYFRLGISQVMGSGRSTDVHGFELADIELYYRGQPVEWPRNMNILGGTHMTTGTLAALFDNDDSTACAMDGELGAFNVDAGTELTFDAYAFRSSTSGDGVCYERLPTAWTLKISTNRKDWVILDNVGNMDAELRPGPGALQGPWNVGNLHPLLPDGPNDSLGDVSKVDISENACLAINAAYEMFGPLCGCGMLDLRYGARAEANATQATVFSGDISGDGTFIAGGTETLTLAGFKSFAGMLQVGGALALDDAEFLGVTNVVLAADGILSGAGAFDGDLSVAFDGGAMDAALTVAGTLDATGGDIALFKVPDDVALSGGSWSFTPFRAGAISAAAKARLSAARAVVPEGAPKYRLRVTCTDTVCTVEAYRPGSVLIIR